MTCNQCGIESSNENPVLRCRTCAHHFCDDCSVEHGCCTKFKSYEQVEAEAKAADAGVAVEARFDQILAANQVEPQEVLDPEMASHVERAMSFDSKFRISTSQAIVYAFLAGAELNWLKSNLKHGHWLKFKEANLPQIPQRSANRYMAFADQIGHVANLPTVSNIKLLSDGKLAPEDEALLAAIFHEHAQGKTLTELYRDTGIIRDKKHQEYHPRKPVSPDDAEKSARSNADEFAKILLGDIAQIMSGDTWSLLSTARQQEIEETRLTLGAFIKDHSPRSRRK